MKPPCIVGWKGQIRIAKVTALTSVLKSVGDRLHDEHEYNEVECIHGATPEGRRESSALLSIERPEFG
jgi:hypothetical protein